MMWRKIPATLRIVIPVYLSLIGALANHKVDDVYASSHPVRTALYEKIFHGQSLIWIAIVIWILLEFYGWFMRKQGNPLQKNLIKFILNQYREQAFNSEHGDSEDHHRVTLFKYKPRHFQIKNSYWITSAQYCAWLRRLWPRPHLVLFLRAGRLSQSTNVVFPVYDDSDKVNGWAAHVWATGCAAVVDHLPDTENGSVQEYATRTKSTTEVIHRYRDAKRKMPRSIAAIPIEVHGASWGVLVLDSRRPNGVSRDSIDDFKITVATIQKILEVGL